MPAGVAVNAVAQGRGKGVFPTGIPFLFLIKVCFDMVDQRISAAAFICVHHLAGAFVDQQNMFIFINHVQKRGSNGQESVFTVRFFKEFVVDVKLQQIASSQPRVALTPLSR